MASPQAPASRPPQVDGMFVDLDYLSALTCTKPGCGSILEWCCSEAGIAELRNWFNGTGKQSNRPPQQALNILHHGNPSSTLNHQPSIM